MKKIIVFALLIGAISFTAYGAKNNGNLNTQATETQAQETESSNTTSKETETEEMLKTTDFGNLPKVAEKVGFSFRALDSLDADDDENNSFKFQNFSISTEKETEINGMKLDEPSYVVKLNYKKRGLIETIVTMFPYIGENLQSTLLNPACYVETEKINGIDVYLSEYIARFVPKDYVLTEEDYAFIDSGKGDLAIDGVTEGDSYLRYVYWIQDGIYYELAVREENYSMDTIRKMVNDIMNADIR